MLSHYLNQRCSDSFDDEIMLIYVMNLLQRDNFVDNINNSLEYCCNNGLGNYVKIKHNDGTYASYSHLKYDSVTVSEGEKVEAGQVIGKMGVSGCVSHMYEHLSVVIVKDMSEDEALEALLMGEVDAKEIEAEDGNVSIYGDPSDLYKIKEAILIAKKEAEFIVDELDRLNEECNDFIDEDDDFKELSF